MEINFVQEENFPGNPQSDPIITVSSVVGVVVALLHSSCSVRLIFFE